MAMKPQTVRQRARARRSCCKGDDIDLGQAADPDLLAGRAGAADHLAAGGDQGPDPNGDSEDGFNLGIYRMQVTGQEHAPSCAGWSIAAARSITARWKGAGKREPLPACRRDRRRSRHHPGRGDAGARHPVGIPVRRPAARQRRSSWSTAKTVPLKVPAEAEIVLEGHVRLDDYGDEGPYGDHTGYYNSGRAVPGVHGQRHHHAARTRSTSPPSPAGRPTSPSVLGEALNEVFIPLLQQQFPEIVDFWLPPEGCSYRIAVVSMKKAYAGHAKRVMMGVWSYLRQFMYTKWVIVVDDDIDARDWKDVMWAISTRMDPARDITVIENTPIDYLDFASPE